MLLLLLQSIKNSNTLRAILLPERDKWREGERERILVHVLKGTQFFSLVLLPNCNKCQSAPFHSNLYDAIFFFTTILLLAPFLHFAQSPPLLNPAPSPTHPLIQITLLLYVTIALFFSLSLSFYALNRRRSCSLSVCIQVSKSFFPLFYGSFRLFLWLFFPPHFKKDHIVCNMDDFLVLITD